MIVNSVLLDFDLEVIQHLCHPAEERRITVRNSI